MRKVRIFQESLVQAETNILDTVATRRRALPHSSTQKMLAATSLMTLLEEDISYNLLSVVAYFAKGIQGVWTRLNELGHCKTTTM
jgi:hypothetical protein